MAVMFGAGPVALAVTVKLAPTGLMAPKLSTHRSQAPTGAAGT